MSWVGHKLADKLNCIGNIWLSHDEINKTGNQWPVKNQVQNKFTFLAIFDSQLNGNIESL